MSVKVTYTAGSNTFHPPLGCTVLDLVECHGGGGGGGGTGIGDEGGGGAGGQYASQINVVVSPSNTYTCVVGNGGLAGASGGGTGGTGGDSTFNSTTVVAKGGVGGTRTTGGLGSTTDGLPVGRVNKGGNGADGATDSGGGGGGASNTGDGENAIGSTGGVAQENYGGKGGNGVTTNTVGLAGSVAGGAGSGAKSISSNKTGGAGAKGRVDVTYTAPSFSNFTDNFDDNSVDPLKWTISAMGGDVAEVNGRMEITLYPDGVANIGVSTNPYEERYNLTGSQVSVKTDFSAMSYNTLFSFNLTSSLESVNFTIENSMLHLIVGVEDTIADVDVTSIKYLRIRESAGTIYAEYSCSGIDWIVIWSGATSSHPGITGVYVTFGARAMFDSVNSLIILDDFNITPDIRPFKGFEDGILQGVL